MSRFSRLSTTRYPRAIFTGPGIVLSLALLVAIFFNRLAAGSLILARGDTLLYFYPYWQAAADALRSGRVPLWNPHLFMGVPFLANSQVGFFYPLNWPLWLTLPTPYAVGYSTMLHLLLAGLGVYLLARRCLSLARSASFLAGVLFSLGGYLTAQVEHINQVQGLAWLPWYFVVLCPWSSGKHSRRQAAKVVSGIAALAALQVLSGHSQTVFISLFAVAIWTIVTFVAGLKCEDPRQEKRRGPRSLARRAAVHFGPAILGVVLAGVLAAVQLLPTLELSRLSLRAGGLPAKEVLSFSLSPLLLGQSLLPVYDRLVFSEYVLFLPIVALLLSAIGFRFAWNRKEAWPFMIVAVSGLALSFGLYNPLYHLLARLPGFNLFRAPARWSVLFVLVLALMAGAGWQALFSESEVQGSASRQSKYARALVGGIVTVLALILWSFVSALIGGFIPTAPEAPVEKPTAATLTVWISELIVAGVAIYSVIRAASGAVRWILFGGTIVMLFLVTRVMPYNDPTTPEAFFDQRVPSSRLLAAAECNAPVDTCAKTTGRVLSLSDIFFDVGDQAEIDTIYQKQLTEKAQFDNTVATKQKEILGPNLPLAYGLQSVDGFDGGLLPLDNFANLMGLILPEGSQSFDGRLREYLDAIPEERWLDLFGVRYIITDKVGDVWREGVFFDLQHPVTMARDDEPVAVGYLPAYEATELWLMTDGLPGDLSVTTDDGEAWSLTPTALAADLWRVQFPRPAMVDSIGIKSCQGEATTELCPAEWQLRALALVDERDGSFTPLVPGQYRLVHSGDVKIYENLDVLPRAFLLHDWDFVRDDESALAIMKLETLDPGRTAVVDGAGSPSTSTGIGEVQMVLDEPEHILLKTKSGSRALLVLTDAYYPGWQATVDGRAAEIVRVDILFRGLLLPPGEHDVEMHFKPSSYIAGRAISVIGLVVWLLLFCYAYLPPFVKRDTRSV